MAKEKVVKLEVKSNVEDVTKGFEKLDKGVKKTTKSINDLNDSTKELEKTNKKLEKSASDYNKKATKGYQKTNKEVSKLDENLKKSNQQFRAGSEVIGFMGDSMSLVGVESEALEDNLKNVDQAMRLGSGVASLKKATDTIKTMGIQAKITAGFQYALSLAVGGTSGALKILRLALISTGIGAIVVGVGLLVANFDKVKKSVSNAIEKFKFLKLAFAPVIASINLVKKGLKLLGIGQGKNAEQEKADAKRREQEAKEDEDRWNDKKDRLNKEYDLKRKLAQKEIDLAKAKGEETAEAERKIITDAIAEAEKNAKEDKEKFEEEARYDIDYWEKKIENEKKALKLLTKIREENIREKLDLSYEEQKVLEKANVSFYDHTNKINEKLEGSYDRLNKFRDRETKKWIKTTKADVESLQKDLQIFDAQEVKDNADKLKRKQDEYKAYAKNRLDAKRELVDRELNAEMLALETEKTLLEAQGEDLTEINQQIFDKELEEEKLNWQRNYDDVLKNEDLTRKEKNAIREAMELEWTATEKQMRSERDAEEIEEAREQAKKLAEIEEARQDNLLELQMDYYARLEKVDNEYFDSQKTAQALEIQAVRDKYYTIEQEAIANGDSIVNIVALREQQIAEIEGKYREEKRQEDLKAIGDNFDMAKQSADALQNLGDLVFSQKMSKLEKGSKEEEELARKQFKFNKAMQLSGAVIDAGKSIITSLASSPLAIGVVPNPVGIASLSLTALTSATNIAKIMATKFSSNQTAPNTPSGNVGGGGDVVSPEFNIVGGAELNDLEGVGQQPLQAYVVSGDVTSAQSLDRNRVENATI